MTNLLLKGLILIVLFVARLFLFPGFAGPLGGFLLISQETLGANLAQDGNSIILMIVSFMVTVIMYSVVASIISFVLERMFQKK